MKKTLIFLYLLCIVGGMYSQTSLILTAEKNDYRTADELIKQQVVFRDPGMSGKDLYWDFRILQPIDEEYSLRYFIPDSTKMSQVCGMEHRTRYYYLQENDTLWAKGYENATTYMEYIKPDLRMRYPFTYGDTLFSKFEGKGEYGRRLKLHIQGTTRVHADAEGELMLPDNETVKKALRIHTQRYYTETGKDSVEMLLDTYSWYAAGNRYPVFESIKTSILKQTAKDRKDTPNAMTQKTDTVIFTTSFYYPPIEQRMQRKQEDINEEDNEDEKEIIDEIFTELSLLPNPVVDKLTIQYHLNREADLTFLIYNNAGMLMNRIDKKQQREGYYSELVDMNQLAPGVYTIYSKADDKIKTINVIKK